MSSSGLNWSSTPLSVDNNDADPWLPIQSKRNQVKQTQQIPNSGRKTIPPPKNKQSDNGIVYGGMVSTNRRTTKPLYVPVPKSAPQIKKKESAIVLKNIGLQARPTAIRALSTTASATSISDSGTALLQTKISNLSKAEKETARSTKDDAGIYDLMMFVKGANGNTKIGSNAVKSVHSRNGKLVIGAQAIAKKPIGVNEEFVKHRFMQGKQKKKAFSKIKKRILMERLQSQMKRLAILNLVTINIESKDADNDSLKLCNFSGTDLHMNQEAQLSQVAETNPRAEARTVSLSQFVTEEDISDESEYEEIIADIKKIFLPFGILESIIIRVHSGLDVHSDTAASGDSISGADESEQQCLVFVTFTSSIAAGAAATAINGSLFGGSPIVAGLCSIDATGGSCEDEQKGLQLINNLKVELFSKTDEDCDANTDPESAGQSDIITNFIANSLGSPLEIDMPHVLRAGVESERDLYLESAVFPDDVADDEETAEVLNDLRSLCEVFGDLSAVWIEKIRHVPSVTVKSELPCSTGIPIDQAAESSSPWVFIEYDTVRDAAVAAVALNGLCVGGEALVVRMYSYSAYVAGKCSDKYCWGSENLSSLNLDDAGTVAERGTSEGAVIAVRNYVTSDDLESSSGDSEELGAIKRDLIDLTAAQGGNESPFIRRVTIMADLGDTEDADTASDETVLGSARLAACVRYSSLAAATTAMLSLDGTLLGGSRLKAWVKRSSTVPQTISLHALASLSVKEELLEDVVVNSGCNHGSSVTANEIIALRNIVRSPTSSETAIAAPLKAGSSLEGADPGTIPTPVGPKRTTANNKEEVVEEVKLPLQSVYKEATLAPKLEKNGAPDSKHRIKVAEEDIDACVKEFLSSIATFQEKMKEKDPIKAAAKRRFVMGIKQATNCVKAGLVKLLILAPDSEASEALDMSLNALLDYAQQNDVAALYCLNRRKLGKAVHSSMKQVVIAVIDADGAYENFKKIIAFINKPAENIP